MKHNCIQDRKERLRLAAGERGGSVMLVALITILVLLLVIGTIMVSTTNKYFTAYQWASWQEALQGAESGADIAMAELRKDVAVTNNAAGTLPWVGWNLGKYKTVNGVKVRDTSTYKLVANDGTYNDGNSGSGNNIAVSVSSLLMGSTPKFDFLTYNTTLSPHQGEGNTNLKITVTVDAPASLTETNTQKRWLRVRTSGTTDLTGPARVSEEKLDNRLRKLGLLFDKVLSGQGEETDPNKLKKQTTRQIELVAKPVSLFSGALTAMVQIKGDDKGFLTDSYNSEDPVNWPVNPGTGEVDFTKSHDPTNPLGKNGDVASNAFPTKHDHAENLDLHRTTIWGDVGNNYAEIKNVDVNYYGQTPDPTDYGLNNGNFGTTNPNTTLIKTNNNTTEGGDISGNIATNYYRDLPPVPEPNWTSQNSSDLRTLTKVNKDTPDLDNLSTNPAAPTRVIVGSVTNGQVVTKGDLTLAGGDKWTLKAAPKPSGWTVATPTVHRYVDIWVTGNIKLDDGGTVVIEQKVDGATGKVISDVQARIFFDHDLKIGETKETKTNHGGFDTQSDDAKDLLLLGVTQPDSGKLAKDSYIDPLGNESVYTPYKASGNIVFKQNDITGAIYAPDHNIIFESDDDGKGKRRKRPQKGNEFYGAYVGRTIHSHRFHYFHYDESLNDAGPAY
ncbi:MAG TPA: hypothetical protein VJ719_11650, partial [Chthoniobacterales bacterium]|nr:hypothetical protein [Chthoniobacterales bacterium]